MALVTLSGEQPRSASSRRSTCIYFDTMKPDLHTASNGFLSLGFGDYDSPLAMAISNFLEADWGFTRDGPAVFGMDEGVSPNFVHGEIVLAAGWDNWSGQYLLSNSKEGDEILRQIFGMISPGNEFRKNSLTKRGSTETWPERDVDASSLSV